MYGTPSYSSFQNNSSYVNPFDPINSTPNRDLAKMYAELESLKQNKVQTQRTVFTDIATEMSDISDDERLFIEGSKEYIALNQQYQIEFSSFLINKFGAEFSSTEYGKTPEKILALIREKKDLYKNQFAANLNEIKQNNKSLIEKNNELVQVNEKLRTELDKIKEKIGDFIS
jgi:hypothetical protein